MPICSFHKSCRAVGWPLLCPLCCPYTLPPATPRPSPPPHSVFPAPAPNSQVQKQLELVNRLCVNWGWKILYQSQRSRGMEQLREEVGPTESVACRDRGLRGRDSRTGMRGDGGECKAHMVNECIFVYQSCVSALEESAKSMTHSTHIHKRTSGSFFVFFMFEIKQKTDLGAVRGLGSKTFISKLTTKRLSVPSLQLWEKCPVTCSAMRKYTQTLSRTHTHTHMLQNRESFRCHSESFFFYFIKVEQHVSLHGLHLLIKPAR